MSKEKQKREYESKQLIEELSKMSPMVIATAYLHAINYTLYGEDVTEKWLTATQNANVLEKAYRKGFMEGVNDTTERFKSSSYKQKYNSNLLDKVMQKQRTIIDDDGVMYKVVLLKDIEDLKKEVSE